ncbi:hypothetical protein BS78_K216100 [Paspalum vaginatum]|uniref:Uncharacterized protein n=1 Tax=Paspalum vaginatum TaxID=158149 RepID=A0A9W7XAN2_9POAL|nr:hypothetical protein BS78_K216100 [Paspalum vaginatum]
MSSKSSFDSSESSTSGSSRSTCLSICKLLFAIFIPTGNMDYNSNSSWHAVRKHGLQFKFKWACKCERTIPLCERIVATFISRLESFMLYA